MAVLTRLTGSAAVSRIRHQGSCNPFSAAKRCGSRTPATNSTRWSAAAHDLRQPAFVNRCALPASCSCCAVFTRPDRGRIAPEQRAELSGPRVVLSLVARPPEMPATTRLGLARSQTSPIAGVNAAAAAYPKRPRPAQRSPRSVCVTPQRTCGFTQEQVRPWHRAHIVSLGRRLCRSIGEARKPAPCLAAGCDRHVGWRRCAPVQRCARRSGPLR